MVPATVLSTLTCAHGRTRTWTVPSAAGGGVGDDSDWSGTKDTLGRGVGSRVGYTVGIDVGVGAAVGVGNDVGVGNEVGVGCDVGVGCALGSGVGVGHVSGEGEGGCAEGGMAGVGDD